MLILCYSLHWSLLGLAWLEYSSASMLTYWLATNSLTDSCYTTSVQKHNLRQFFCVAYTSNTMGTCLLYATAKLQPYLHCSDNKAVMSQYHMNTVLNWNRWRALVNSVLNLRVPRKAGKLSSGLTSSGLLSSAKLHLVSYTVLYYKPELD
jgi:hypothetical protein